MNKKELEQFVAEYDAQVSIRVQLESMDDALPMLMREGFIPVRDRFECVGKWAISMSLVEFWSRYRITFVLDVPGASPQTNPLGTMFRIAKKLATQCGGTIVDDAGRPLEEEEFVEIGKQVESFYARMEAAGIPAGSPEALRLFGDRRRGVSPKLDAPSYKR